jgi:hypothetical protein
MERISSLAPPLPLSSYYLMRWCCCAHGYFESGTEVLARVACPECGEDAGLVDQCRGLTIASCRSSPVLAWTSLPTMPNSRSPTRAE